MHAVGLDVAGVDLIAADLCRPLSEQGGGILEINAEPAIVVHMSPNCRPPRPVPEAILAHLFPQPGDSRIPIVAVCGAGEHSENTLKLLARWLTPLGHRVGSVSEEGVFVGGRRLCLEARNPTEGVRSLLTHPRVDAVVCQLTVDEIRERGLAFDQCSVAVLLDLRGDGSWQEDRDAAAGVLIESVAAEGTVIVNVDGADCARLMIAAAAGVIPISPDDSESDLAAIAATAAIQALGLEVPSLADPSHSGCEGIQRGQGASASIRQSTAELQSQGCVP